MRELLAEHGVEPRVGLADADEAADEAAAATELESNDDVDPTVQKHRDAVQRGTETNSDG